MTAAHSSCFAKQQELIEIFKFYSTVNEKYAKVIELGRGLAPFQEQWKLPFNLVSGCQSQVYLHSTLQNEKIIFYATADALISAGLVALLFAVYNEEPPQAIISCKPFFIEELGLNTLLSPGRSHGLSYIHLRMKQEALKFLVSSK